MTGRDLTTRVTTATAIAVLALALGTAGLAGGRGALGVLAGGALALASFRALAARALAVSADRPAVPWLIVSTLRLGAVVAVAAGLFVCDLAHPLAVLAGYTMLPVAVVVQGLRLAREESTSWT
jgi:ATP synthase I subunit